MSQDISHSHLNEFLNRLHLGAEVYYVGQLCDVWHMSTPRLEGSAFHLLCNGEAWVHMEDGSKPIHLRDGDIAFFPHYAAHSFSGKPQLPQQPFDYSHPAPLDRTAPGTGLLCGHLTLPLHIRRLLMASFPEFMLIRPDTSPIGRQLRVLIELMTDEATRNEVGVTAILNRLSDSLFLYVIRHAVYVDPALSPLLAALSDENLRLAMLPFIEHPEEGWTVERMAALACQSRSAFTERFSKLVKIPPMEFVATWRMQLAAGLLAQNNANMLDVALRCGYESEVAFRKAFKRITGTTPGKARSKSAHTTLDE